MGPDKFLLLGEIQKVVVYMGEDTHISEKTLLDLLPFNPQTTIFNLMDAIIYKKRGKALLYLFQLLETEPPLKIGATLSTLFFNAYTIKRSVEKGEEIEEIAKRLGKKRGGIEKELKRFSKHTSGALFYCFERSLEMDGAIKTGRISPHLALQLFVLEVSG